MRVVFIHPFFNRYARGIERFTANISSSLARQDISVDIITWRWPKQIMWSELDPRVQLQAFPTSRFYAAKAIVPVYTLHLLRHLYDMIYIQFADYGEAVTLNALKHFNRCQPYTIVLHYPVSQVPHRYRAMREAGLHDRAANIIAVSQHVAREAEAYWGRRSTVISHGVDAERFRPDAIQRARIRQQIGISNDVPMLLTVSALEERKGVQWVLKALPYLARRFPEIIYVIVGDGPYGPRLSQLAGELKVEPFVRWIPSTPDVTGYYQASDIKLILSKGEASSIVTLEALASGLPVIASQNPPFDELISSDWGLQVDEEDTQQLVQSVTALLVNAELRHELGVAGRRHIHQYHSWDQIARAYRQLIL